MATTGREFPTLGGLPGLQHVGPQETEEDSGLRDFTGIAEQFFLPELERIRERQPELEADLLSMLKEGPDFSRARQEMSALAEGVADDLFRPGGAVEDATSQALRATTETGFGPSSGGFDRARQNILGRARERITSQVAQQAPALAQVSVQDFLGRSGQMGDFAMNQAGLANDLSQSLVGIEGTRRQADLAERGMNLQELVAGASLDELDGADIGDILGGTASGALSGAAIGSVVPGLGTLAGGIIGGAGSLLGGLF